MAITGSRLEVPLKADREGTIRVGNTGVTLDSVIYHYKEGASADEIVWRFPALELADVHAALAYYLNHQNEVEQYLKTQAEGAAKLKREISEDSVHQRRVSEALGCIRERLVLRKTTNGC